MGGALLVPDQDVAHRIVEHGIVRRQDRASGIPEDDVHAFAHEAFPEDLCTRQLHATLLYVVSPRPDRLFEKPPKTKTPEVSLGGLCRSRLGFRLDHRTPWPNNQGQQQQYQDGQRHVALREGGQAKLSVTRH
jgi:hypothetical protein